MPVHDAQLEQVGIALEAAQPSGAAVGRVDEASEGSAVLLGKRVLVSPLDACGQCEVCRRGGAAVCPQARPPARVAPARIRASSRWLVTLGDGLDLPVPAAAAVAGDVTCAYTLYARTGLSPRDPVVLVGTTPVTRFLVEILRSKAITPTVILDRDEPGWRDWLAGKGAAVVSADDNAFVASVTAAITAQGQGAKPLRLIATMPSALPHAIALAGPRATITALVSPSTLGQLGSIAADVLAREVTLIGVAGPHPDLVVEAAALCVKGEIDLAGGVVVGTASDPTRAHVTPIG